MDIYANCNAAITLLSRMQYALHSVQAGDVFNIDLHAVGSVSRLEAFFAPVKALRRLWRWENAVCPDGNPRQAAFSPPEALQHQP